MAVLPRKLQPITRKVTTAGALFFLFIVLFVLLGWTYWLGAAVGAFVAHQNWTRFAFVRSIRWIIFPKPDTSVYWWLRNPIRRDHKLRVLMRCFPLAVLIILVFVYVFIF